MGTGDALDQTKVRPGLQRARDLHGCLSRQVQRYNVRTVKCGISRYHTWNHHTDTRPLTSITITAIDIIVTQPAPPTRQPAPAPTRRRPTPTAKPRQRRASTPQPTPTRRPPTPRPPSRWPTIQAILHQTPALPRRARDIARTLGITGEQALNSFCVQMSTWARHGRLTKTAPATYLITPELLTATP